MAVEPPRSVLAELSASRPVNRLVDRRLLFECAVTHYAANNATAEKLGQLDRLTQDIADSTDWSDYHQADEQFHQLVGTARLGTAVEVYHEMLAELYAYFIPYPIELLHDVISQPLQAQFEAFLDEHRNALTDCLNGLTEEQARRSLAPSRTTLLGPVKHATFVEKAWFDEAITCRPRAENG